MSCNSLIHDETCECTREAVLRKLRASENLIRELGLAASRQAERVTAAETRIDELQEERRVQAKGHQADARVWQAERTKLQKEVDDWKYATTRAVHCLGDTQARQITQAEKDYDAEGRALFASQSIQETKEQAQVTPAEAVPVASNSGVNGGRERADPPVTTQTETRPWPARDEMAKAFMALLLEVDSRIVQDVLAKANAAIAEAAQTRPDFPAIDWVKNDPNEHQLFTDRSIFLVALQTGKTGGPYKWDFDVVKVNCDGDGMYLEDREGNSYDAWSWEDFEYFSLLDGDMPSKAPKFTEGHTGPCREGCTCFIAQSAQDLSKSGPVDS